MALAVVEDPLVTLASRASTVPSSETTLAYNFLFKEADP